MSQRLKKKKKGKERVRYWCVEHVVCACSFCQKWLVLVTLAPTVAKTMITRHSRKETLASRIDGEDHYLCSPTKVLVGETESVHGRDGDSIRVYRGSHPNMLVSAMGQRTWTSTKSFMWAPFPSPTAVAQLVHPALSPPLLLLLPPQPTNLGRLRRQRPRTARNTKPLRASRWGAH